MTNTEFEASIKLIISNNKDGLESIYKEYITSIYSLVLSIVKNKENAEDITADFFIKLWLKAHTYNFNGHHKRWLMTLAHNMSIDFLRKNSKELLTEDIHIDCNSSSSMESEVHDKLLMNTLLSNLNISEREIVILHLVNDLTFKDISKILNRPLGSVAWQYNSALKKLRRFQYE